MWRARHLEGRKHHQVWIQGSVLRFRGFAGDSSCSPFQPADPAEVNILRSEPWAPDAGSNARRCFLRIVCLLHIRSPGNRTPQFRNCLAQGFVVHYQSSSCSSWGLFLMLKCVEPKSCRDEFKLLFPVNVVWVCVCVYARACVCNKHAGMISPQTSLINDPLLRGLPLKNNYTSGRLILAAHLETPLPINSDAFISLFQWPEREII